MTHRGSRVPRRATRADKGGPSARSATGRPPGHSGSAATRKERVRTPRTQRGSPITCNAASSLNTDPPNAFEPPTTQLSGVGTIPREFTRSSEPTRPATLSCPRLPPSRPADKAPRAYAPRGGVRARLMSAEGSSCWPDPIACVLHRRAGTTRQGDRGQTMLDVCLGDHELSADPMTATPVTRRERTSGPELAF